MTGNISTEIAVVKADVGNLVVDDPVLTKYATEIRRLGRRVKEDVVEIGRYLDQAQKHAGHGTWLTWIEAEFGWSDQTAYHFIHLYQACQNPEFQKFWNSDLPLSALYRLAAPNTPTEARQQVAERIEAGETLSPRRRARTQIRMTMPNHDVGIDDEDPSIAQRRREHAERFGGPEDIAAASTDEVNGAEDSSVESGGPAAELLLEDWDLATAEERQFIRDLVLEEFFAQASGADIFARIPADRLDAVCLSFLDRLTVKGMRTRMSAEFGKELRRQKFAPAERKKSARKWKKSINHRAHERAHGFRQ